MLRKIPIIIAIALCTLVVGQYAIGAEDPASQLKQAEELAKNKKYDQAEQIYLAIAKQDIPEAFDAQKSLAILYIIEYPARLDLADAAYEQLLGRFANHDGLPKAIYQIARRYDGIGENDRALGLYEYDVEQFPDSMYAMWSQVEIIKPHILSGNEQAADAGYDKLLTIFSKQPTLPKEIYQLGKKYELSRRYDKAMELHQYNVDHFPDDLYAMWSQVEIVKSYIRDANDAAVNKAFDRLLSVFAEQKTLPREVYQVGVAYSRSGKSDKARGFYQYVIDNWPETEYAIRSQLAILGSQAQLNTNTTADMLFDELFNVFVQQKTPPEDIYEIAMKYTSSWSDKARQIHQYNVDNSPEDNKYTILSQVEVVKSYIRDGNEPAVGAAIDRLIADFNDQPVLPTAIFQVGEQYYYKAMGDVNEGRTTQANANFAKTISVWDRIITQAQKADLTTIQDSYYFLAYCYGQLGDHEKALQYWQKIVNEWPDYKYAWDAQFRIAYTYAVLGDSSALPKAEAYERMEQAYEAIITDYPNCPFAKDACVRLGNINFVKSQWHEAVRFYELFLEKFPGDERWNKVLYKLGSTYEKMGQLQRAIELYKAFLEVANPDDPLVKQVKVRLGNLEGLNQ